LVLSIPMDGEVERFAAHRSAASSCGASSDSEQPVDLNIQRRGEAFGAGKVACLERAHDFDEPENDAKPRGHRATVRPPRSSKTQV
jgi:hypothetical protein